tara:strand:+ start:2402 stop:2593 length:192 start_codon:yes stop_codon:yes gene_type:complete
MIYDRKSPYVVEGQPSVEVDVAYFKSIQSDSHLLDYLRYVGVEDWDGYNTAVELYEDEEFEDE